ncbi:proteasome assembly chaperone 2 [Dipodascopsis tothii]|uniref:proteasome assembly chaperone 2 n=1 Tax=Dipodascopsis tothii TaxID=44089 RepID=UPI0034CD4FDB
MATIKMTTLILPAVSTANIPQLSVDLIVSTLHLQYEQSLDDLGTVYPFTSPSDYHPAVALSTAIQVFSRPDLGITCLQQRSPTLPGSKTKFIEDVLLPFIRAGNFSRIILLSSSDAARRLDVRGSRSVLLNDQDLLGLMKSLQISEPHTSSVTRSRLPGSGVTVPLLCALAGLYDKTTLQCLVRYAFDGDNFEDAHQLAKDVLEILGASDTSVLSEPKSWKGVYGKPVKVGIEHGLYG